MDERETSARPIPLSYATPQAATVRQGHNSGAMPDVKELHPVVAMVFALIGIGAGILGVPLLLVGVLAIGKMLLWTNREDASFSSDLVAAIALFLLGVIFVCVARGLWKRSGAVFAGR